MKRIHYIYSLLVFVLILPACTSAQLPSSLGDLQKSAGDLLKTDALSTDEVVAGLKEALVKGSTSSTASASKLDGYYKNLSIKIPFPPDVKMVEDKLRQVGLGSEVDKFIVALNRGAEQAAKEAKPIFVNAITSMTVQDGWGILKGEKNAATQYLQKKTGAELKAKFQPIVAKALASTQATKYYSDLVTTYNKIPFVTKVNPNLEEYATTKAMDGLFKLVADEEAAIRANPASRTTDLLKKVFGSQK